MLVSGQHDRGLALVIMAAIAPVGINPFGIDTGYLRGLGDGVGQGSRLYLKALQTLLRQAKRHGILSRRSNTRVAKGLT